MSTPDSWTDSTGEWLTASNWSDGLPNATSAVTIVSLNGGIIVSYNPGTFSEPAIFSLQTGSGATLDVVSGTLSILDGDSLLIAGGLINTGTFELSGGDLTINSEISNSGLIEVASNSGATASLVMDTDFDPNAHGTITVGTQGIAVFGSEAVPAVQSVTLTAITAQLLLGDSVNFNAPISGFKAGNTIDFTDILYASTDTIQYNTQPGGGRLIIDDSNSNEVATVLLTGTYSQSQFQLGDYGDRSLEVVLAPCYAAGTRIATPKGERAVERLRAGDAVLTAAGEARPIVWIGQRRVDCRRHPWPELVLPVRVHAGAFGERLPRRDLLLSPDHAVFVEGVLIPIKHLVNNLTVVQERTGDVHYFHVELARHDVLLAEGLPAESYLDTGNRPQFEGGASYLTLHPDFSPLRWDDTCAALCTDGPVLAEVRRRLADRVGVLGYLQVFADGRNVRAVGRRGRVHCFLLPPAARELRIRSRKGFRVGGAFVGGRSIALEGRKHRATLPSTLLRDAPMLLEVSVLDTRCEQRPAESAAA